MMAMFVHETIAAAIEKNLNLYTITKKARSKREISFLNFACLFCCEPVKFRLVQPVLEEA